jgi:hypothetical protein
MRELRGMRELRELPELPSCGEMLDCACCTSIGRGTASAAGAGSARLV